MITSDQARSLHETTKYPAKKIADALDYHFQSIDKVFKEIFRD
jgi:hypothetical protein